jgi:hypothetical protein
MRRCFVVLMLGLLSTAFALAATPHPTLRRALWGHHHQDPRVQRHHAHKAGKHHTPKRSHHHST